MMIGLDVVKKLPTTDDGRSSTSHSYWLSWTPDVMRRVLVLAQAIRDTEANLLQSGIAVPNFTLNMAQNERNTLWVTVLAALNRLAFDVTQRPDSIDLTTWQRLVDFYLANRSKKDRRVLSRTYEVDRLLTTIFEHVNSVVDLPYFVFAKGENRMNTSMIVLMAIAYAYECEVKRTG